MKKIIILFDKFSDSKKHIYTICKYEEESNIAIVCGTWNTKNGTLRFRDIKNNPLKDYVQYIIKQIDNLKEEDYKQAWRITLQEND